MIMLFALGSLGFWILLSVVCILLIAAVEYERPGWATLSLIATFSALAYFGDFNILTFAKENPLIATGCFVGYFVAGALWALGKWWFFLRARRENYNDTKAEFLRQHGITGQQIPDNLLKEWQEQTNWFIDNHHRRPTRYAKAQDTTSVAPRARDHKSRILTWMAYWPWSMFWTMINDFVKRVFKTIYEEIQVLFQKISDKVFAGVEDDFRPATPTPPAAPNNPAETNDGPVLTRRNGRGDDHATK